MEATASKTETKRDPMHGPSLQEIIEKLPPYGASKLCRTQFDDESPLGMLINNRRELRRLMEVIWLLIEDVFEKHGDTGVRSVLEDVWASLIWLDEVQKAALIEIQLESGDTIRI